VPVRHLIVPLLVRPENPVGDLKMRRKASAAPLFMTEISRVESGSVYL